MEDGEREKWGTGDGIGDRVIMQKMLLAIFAIFSAPALARAGACPNIPPPVADITIERFYEDGAGSIVEPTRLEAHKAQMAPLVEFVGTITKLADRAWQQRSEPSGTVRCALSWIAAWAKGGAYLGKMSSKQAEYQRKWDLAGTALAYVKLKKWASAEERAAIEPWLKKWAGASRAFFDDASVKRNNHWYWLGLAVAGVGLATDDDAYWQKAKGIYADAMKDISAGGTLALEMERKGRALYYHVFAVEPLVVLAEIAAAKGEDWYALNEGALHRLVKATVEGLADPEKFDELAGEKQQRPVKPGYGWASLYRERFFDRMQDRIDQPIGHRWLGGDVDVLKRAIAK